MNLYREKRSKAIEAFQYDGSYASIRQICDWANTLVNMARNEGDPIVDYITRGDDETITDVMFHADPDNGPRAIQKGQWVIKDGGFFYTMSDKTFKVMYERHAMWRARADWDSEGEMTLPPRMTYEEARKDRDDLAERMMSQGHDGNYSVEPVL